VSLRRYTVRAMRQRPGRTILTMLSIVIGVTAAVAVGLGTATTRNAYKQMFAMVTGKASLEIDGKGGAAFENTVLEKVEKIAGVEAAAPVLNRMSAITVGEGQRLRVQLLGIDPERDPKVRDYSIVEGRQVQKGEELVFEKGFAEHLGVKVGETIKVTANNARNKPFELVGLFKKNAGVDLGLASMGFMPLETAQASFISRSTVVSRNAIDMIQVVTAKNVEPEKAEPAIANVLRTVTLTVTRGEETLKVDVRLPEKVAPESLTGDESQGALILQVQGEDQSGGGVRLTQVTANGPAAMAGLKEGDIITHFEGDKVANYLALGGKTRNRWGVHVHRPTASTQLMQETLLSTEQGLTLTTYFSLLMAAFIILNTFLMNVSERRRQLSILRAIGAKKDDVSKMLLGEAIILGVLGIIVGLALGVVLAFLGTFLVGRAFDVQLPRLVEVITPWPFVIGTVFGLVMTLLGAVLPAYLAGQVSPLEGMNRVASVRKWDFTRELLIAGVVTTVVSLALTYACITGRLPIQAATYCAVALLIGLVLIGSTALGPQASFVAGLLKWASPVETGMALRQVLRNHMRSALTVAVLFIAGSTGVGMASSIIDCVHDVHNWFGKAITADYVIRSMMPDMATGTAPDLPAEIEGELAKLAPELHFRYEGMSFIQAQLSPDKEGGNPLSVIAVSREFNDPKPPSFDLLPGADPTQLREKLLAGEVVIGSVLSMKANLKLGDKLPLETKEGTQQIPICGVANEYMVGGMAIHMARPFAEKWLGVEGHDGYVIKVEEGHSLAAVKAELETLVKKYDALLMSQADLKRSVDQFVSGTEWSLWLLVLTGFIVGAFGVVNTLTMNVLEQTRELGLLRIVAMTKKQVRRTILMQALIIGGVGLPPGILLGVGVAYVINLAMMPSFGHPVEFAWHPRMLLGILVGAFVIVLIAALIPARRATQINVVEALHYE
jgi:putative ABC transport system permease protein